MFQINDPPLCSLTDSLLGCFQVTFTLRPPPPINPSVIHYSPEINAPCLLLILLKSIASANDWNQFCVWWWFLSSFHCFLNSKALTVAYKVFVSVVDWTYGAGRDRWRIITPLRVWMTDLETHNRHSNTLRLHRHVSIVERLQKRGRVCFSGIIFGFAHMLQTFTAVGPFVCHAGLSRHVPDMLYIHLLSSHLLTNKKWGSLNSDFISDM